MQKISELIPQMQIIPAVPITQEAQEKQTRDYWLKVQGKEQNAYMPSKTVTVPWGKNKLPDFARFRMAVRFKNLKYAYYPSYDYNYALQDGKQIQLYDEQIGLEKLFTLQAKESQHWNWIAISIFVNIVDKWADAQERRYNYLFKSWKFDWKHPKKYFDLHWYNGRLDLDYTQMMVAQNNIIGFSTAEERAKH